MNIFRACILEHNSRSTWKVHYSLKQIVCLFFFFMHPISAELEYRYSSNLHETKWQAIALPQEATEKLQCGLVHEIPHYGTITFKHEAGGPLMLFLDSYRAPTSASMFKVIAKTPDWKYPATTQLLFETKFPAIQNESITNSDNVWKILNALEGGFIISFNYEVKQNKQNDQIDAEISPVSFQSAFFEFLACEDNLLPFGFDTIAVSVINFDYESYELNEQAKRMLWRIKRYFTIEPSIKNITIEGHSDGLGKENYNRFISEKRALSVRKFFIEEMKLPKSKVLYKALGGSQPVASNDTDYGRSMNRRAVVKLYRQDEKVIGVKPLRKQL